MHGLDWYDSSARYYDHVLGRFHQIDYVGGGFHYRPSANEGRVYYTAKLNNGELVGEYTMAALREAIVAAGKDGIEPEE